MLLRYAKPVKLGYVHVKQCPYDLFLLGKREFKIGTQCGVLPVLILIEYVKKACSERCRLWHVFFSEVFVFISSKLEAGKYLISHENSRLMFFGVRLDCAEVQHCFNKARLKRCTGICSTTLAKKYRYSQDIHEIDLQCDHVISCNIDFNLQRELTTCRYRGSCRCRTKARYHTISHDRTVDQPREFLGCNDFLAGVVLQHYVIKCQNGQVQSWYKKHCVVINHVFFVFFFHPTSLSPGRVACTCVGEFLSFLCLGRCSGLFDFKMSFCLFVCLLDETFVYHCRHVRGYDVVRHVALAHWSDIQGMFFFFFFFFFFSFWKPN